MNLTDLFELPNRVLRPGFTYEIVRRSDAAVLRLRSESGEVACFDAADEERSIFVIGDVKSVWVRTRSRSFKFSWAEARQLRFELERHGDGRTERLETLQFTEPEARIEFTDSGARVRVTAQTDFPSVLKATVFLEDALESGLVRTVLSERVMTVSTDGEYALPPCAPGCNRFVRMEIKSVDDDGVSFFFDYRRAYIAAADPDPDARPPDDNAPTIHLVCPSLSRNDGVGSFFTAMRDLLLALGHRVRSYAGAQFYFIPESYSIEDLDRFVRPQDTIILHFAAFDPSLRFVLEARAARKLVYFHNVTPPEYFEGWDAIAVGFCRKGRLQFPFFRHFDQVIANSEFSARHCARMAEFLRDCGAAAPDAQMPPQRAFAPIRLTGYDFERAPAKTPESASRSFLYVGRVVAHKRVAELIELFRAYRKIDPGMHLVIVGSASGEYGERVRRTADTVGNVTFRSDVGHAELSTLYRIATAYLSLSLHEGFGLPFVDAMGNGVPVFYSPSAGSRETLGSTDGLLEDTLDATDAAARIWQVLSNEANRTELLARQSERLREILDRNSAAEFLRMLGLSS